MGFMIVAFEKTPGKNRAVTRRVPGELHNHHVLLTRLHLDRIDGADARISMLTEQISQHLEAAGIMWARDLLVTVPRIRETGPRTFSRRSAPT